MEEAKMMRFLICTRVTSPKYKKSDKKFIWNLSKEQIQWGDKPLGSNRN